MRISLHLLTIILICFSLSTNHHIWAGGQVVSWDNRGSYKDTPVDIDDAVQIVSGYEFQVALREDGTVVAWGNNNHGQLNVPEDLDNVVSISAGAAHILALRKDGTIVAWGDLSSELKSEIAALENVILISAGDRLNTALTTNGSPILIAENVFPYEIDHHALMQSQLDAFEDIIWLSRQQSDFSGEEVVAIDLNGNIAIASGFSPGSRLMEDQGDFQKLVQSIEGSIVALGRTGNFTIIKGFNFNFPQSIRLMDAIVLYDNFIGIQMDGTPFALHRSSWQSIRLPEDLHFLTSIAKPDQYETWAIKTDGPAPAITSDNLIQAIQGIPFYHQISTANNATTFEAFGLPDGLTLDPTNGKISGIFPDLGKAAFLVIAKNEYGHSSQIITLQSSIGSPPTDIDFPELTVSETFMLDTTLGTFSTQDPDPGNNHLYSLVDGEGSTSNDYFSISGNRLLLKRSFDFESQNLHSFRIRSTDPGSNYIEKTFLIEVANSDQDDDDRDGLSEAEEIILETDPLKEDTDSDGSNDGVEIAYGTDPNDSNSWPPIAAWAEHSAQELKNVPLGFDDIIDIAVEGNNAIALKKSGQVIGWGKNTQFVDSIPTDLDNVIAVSISSFEALALTKDGTVINWDSRGHLDVPNEAFDIVGITANDFGNHYAIKSDGTVIAWSNGSIRYHDSAAVIDAVDVVTDSDLVAVTRANGRAQLWGNNFFDQLNIPGSLFPVKQIDFGPFDSIGLRDDGRVFTWGSNSDPIPYQVGNNITAVATGFHKLALTNTGTVIQWENNSLEYVPENLNHVVAIDANSFVSVALRSRQKRLPLNPERLIIAEEGRSITYSALAANAVTTEHTLVEAMFLPQGLTLDPSTGFISGTMTQPGNYSSRILAWEQNTLNSQIIHFQLSTGTPPTQLSLDKDSIIEELAIGTTVINITTQDSESDNSFVYKLIPGQGDADNESFEIDGDSLKIKKRINYEQTPEINIRLRVTDSGNQTLEQSFQINVTNSLNDDDDEDGLTEEAEITLQTDPNVADTDGDGVNDGDEVEQGTDPLVVDNSIQPLPVTVWNSNGFLDLPDQVQNMVDIEGNHKRFGDFLGLTPEGSLISWRSGTSYSLQFLENQFVVKDLVVVDAAFDDVAGIKKDGTVLFWDGSPNNPTTLPGIHDAVDIAVSDRNFVLVLRADGSITEWSSNADSEPLVNFPQTKDIIAISANDDEALALKANGEVIRFGNSNSFRFNPSNDYFPELENIIAIAARNGFDGHLALTADGMLHEDETNQFSRNIPNNLPKLSHIQVGKNFDDDDGIGLTDNGEPITWSRTRILPLPSPITDAVDVTVGYSGRYAALRNLNRFPEIELPRKLILFQNSSFDYQIESKHAPEKYEAIGLPAGLELNETTGKISGVPVESGIFNIRITAYNAQGFSSELMHFEINKSPPEITSISKRHGAVSEYITLTGKNFETFTAFLFEDELVKFHVQNTNTLLVRVPGSYEQGKFYLASLFGTAYSEEFNVMEHADSWRLQFFNQIDAQSPASDFDDPDRDKRINLLEYISGLNPIKADPKLPIQAGPVVTVGNVSYTTFTFQRSVHLNDAYKISYEESFDLVHWFPIDPAQNQIGQPKISGKNPNLEYITIRSNQPLSQQNTPSIFFRYHVEEIESE